MPNAPTNCPDCGEPFAEDYPILAMLAHWEEGCPSTTVEVAIAITTNGRVFSVPEFHPTPEMPDLPSLLRFMADKVIPA